MVAFVNSYTRNNDLRLSRWNRCLLRGCSCLGFSDTVWVGYSHVLDIFAGQEITLGVTIAVTAL